MMNEFKGQVWNLVAEMAKKKGITELAINARDRIFIERSGQFFFLNNRIEPAELARFCQDVAKFNRINWNEDHPFLDGTLPDGSRINMVHESYADGQPAITIRRYANENMTFHNNPSMFGLNAGWIDLFRIMVGSKKNIVVSGGTSSGKTTFLNMMIRELSPSERLIIIEDTKELNITFPNVVRLVNTPLSDSNVSFRDLVKNSLRMRPDRIVIGEIRGGEVFDLLNAMNSGHEGSFTSIHANSSTEALKKMETLYLLSGFDFPLVAIRQHISSAIDFIIQLGRDKTGNRIVKHIYEVQGMEGDTVLTSCIANRAAGGLHSTGLSPQCLEGEIPDELRATLFT